MLRLVLIHSRYRWTQFRSNGASLYPQPTLGLFTAANAFGLQEFQSHILHYCTNGLTNGLLLIRHAQQHGKVARASDVFRLLSKEEKVFHRHIRLSHNSPPDRKFKQKVEFQRLH